MASSKEVVRLAQLVSDAKDQDIPLLLTRLKPLLQQYPGASEHKQTLKYDILNYDLLSWCSVALKYDFAKVQGGFSTAVGIIEVLFECSSGIDVSDYKDFEEVVLSDALNSSLSIAWGIQQDYLNFHKLSATDKYGAHAKQAASVLHHYKKTIDVLMRAITSHTGLVSLLLKSDNLIRILIEEDTEVENTIISALELVLRAVRVNPSAVRSIPPIFLNHLLDELIYRITTSKNDKVTSVTVKVVVAMIDSDSDLSTKLSVRFKGLKALMTQWLGHGFDKSLKALIDTLDAGNSEIAELARRTRAVTTIWAAYQGWKTRARVGKLHVIIPKLQSSFRQRRQENLESKLKEKLSNEWMHEAEMNRRRSMRLAKEKQLKMLEIVPAAKVDKYIQGEEEAAAVKIQSLWRGSSQRKLFKSQQNLHRETRAAITIQRAIKQYFAKTKKSKKKIPAVTLINSKLSNNEKGCLQMKIDQWQEIRGMKETSLSEARKVHLKTQHKLVTYYANKAQKVVSKDAKIQATLVKLHTELELVETLPILAEARPDMINNLPSNSTAVCLAAEKEHRQKMNEFTMKWWQVPLRSGESFYSFLDKYKPVEEREETEELDLLMRNVNRGVLF